MGLNIKDTGKDHGKRKTFHKIILWLKIRQKTRLNVFISQKEEIKIKCPALAAI